MKKRGSNNPKMTGIPNKLFVGGLSANTDDDGLRQHFERFGELIDHVVIKHKVQSRSRCFGFVTYAKPEQADAAMAAIPHTVDGTAVEVKRAVAKEKSKEPESFARAMEKKIFVGGLKNDIFEFQLTEYFSQYGQVEKSEIMVDLETRQNRGFGFVHFTNASAADKAALVKFHTVNGHQVEVKKALTKKEIKGEGAHPGARPGVGTCPGQVKLEEVRWDQSPGGPPPAAELRRGLSRCTSNWTQLLDITSSPVLNLRKTSSSIHRQFVTSPGAVVWPLSFASFDLVFFNIAYLNLCPPQVHPPHSNLGPSPPIFFRSATLHQPASLFGSLPPCRIYTTALLDHGQ
uniref:RRM domain-containing protein n=1 Tax=Oryzias melastigma TaxID=30732 RepID=A0A3B3CZN0_ORYME